MIPKVLLKDKSRKAISEISRDEMLALKAIVEKLRILDIDNVEPQYLPYLAKQFRVEFWDDAWSVDVQREKVKTAFKRFKKLGTPFAVENALDFLSDIYGYPLSLTEWFNMNPEGQRGTFSINIDSDGKEFELNDEYYSKLCAGVEANKRKSQHWGIRITGGFSGNCYLAGYLRAAEHVIFPPPALEFVGIGANDWFTSTFEPTTSFAGAIYSLVVQYGIPPISYKVESGEATVNDAGDITITGSGSITVSATDSMGTVITHTINPKLWFIRSDDFFPAISEQIEAWVASMNARIPLTEEVSPVMPYISREMGTLNNEWGDLAAFGWPHDSNNEAADSNKYALSLTHDGEIREYAWLCGGHAGNCGSTSSNLYINGLCVIDVNDVNEE